MKAVVTTVLLLLLALTLDAKSILYKVTSKTSTVYLLGSIHLAKPELYPLKSAIEDAYANSDILVLELDPTSAESTRVFQGAMLTLGTYPHGKTLKTELSATTYELLEAHIDRVGGISLNAMQGTRPWVVVMQLSVMEMMRLGYSPEYGIDQHFLQKARRQHKKVLELETAAEQVELLSKNDKQYQDLMLRYTLESMHEMEPLLEKMFQSWISGDAEGLSEVLDSSLVVDPRLDEVYDALITKRNYKMTDKIVGYLKTDKNYFVVVGAGHVVGPEGIVKLLRKNGFIVEQE